MVQLRHQFVSTAGSQHVRCQYPVEEYPSCFYQTASLLNADPADLADITCWPRQQLYHTRRLTLYPTSRPAWAAWTELARCAHSVETNGAHSTTQGHVPGEPGRWDLMLDKLNAGFYLCRRYTSKHTTCIRTYMHTCIRTHTLSTSN